MDTKIKKHIYFNFFFFFAIMFKKWTSPPNINLPFSLSLCTKIIEIIRDQQKIRKRSVRRPKLNWMCLLTLFDENNEAWEKLANKHVKEKRFHTLNIFCTLMSKKKIHPLIIFYISEQWKANFGQVIFPLFFSWTFTYWFQLTHIICWAQQCVKSLHDWYLKGKFNPIYTDWTFGVVFIEGWIDIISFQYFLFLLFTFFNVLFLLFAVHF